MPDLERLTDELAIDLATGDQKAYWRGFAKGKSRARFEILILSVLVTIGAIWVAYYR